MLNTERIIEISGEQNKPIKDVFKFPVLRSCQSLLEKHGELSVQDREQFIYMFIVLSGGTKTHGVRLGKVEGYNSDGEFWQVNTTRVGETDRVHMYLIDERNSYGLDVHSSQPRLHITPGEEGIWATDQTISDSELRDWFGMALDVYKNSKLPFPEKYSLYRKAHERKKLVA